MDDDGYVFLEVLREIRDELREINSAVRAMNAEPAPDVAVDPLATPQPRSHRALMRVGTAEAPSPPEAWSSRGGGPPSTTRGP